MKNFFNLAAIATFIAALALPPAFTGCSVDEAGANWYIPPAAAPAATNSGQTPAATNNPTPAQEPAPTPTPEPPSPEALATPLTLEACVAGAVVTFDNKAAGPVTYKVNGGEALTIASGESASVTLENVGGKVEFWGDNKTYATDDSNYSNITCSDDCYIYGNMMSLIKSVGFEKETVLEENSTFYRLFEHNACIKNKEGSDLLLPATTLAAYCYDCMFQGCKGLTRAPTLPATSLAEACYGNMFSDCKSLESVPALPATSLARRCYAGMFAGSNLTTAPTLPAMTLAERCYDGMFKQCANLATAPDLPATTLTESCYYGMFFDCKSLTSAPALPATTLAKKCYGNMFFGCKSLTSAPILPATTLADYCYASMFYGCKSLTTAPELKATTLAERCYQEMFSGCTSLATATSLPATTLAESCYYFMFSGCTSLTAAPSLPATTLEYGCYSYMFSYCASLKAAPSLPATTLADYCYQSMFYGCKILKAAPDLPATTLAEGCYSSMFYNCTSLTAAPSLPATSLATWCYDHMFYGCTSLASVTCLATDISTSDYTIEWLKDVAANGTFTKAAGMTWPTGASGIPSGWTYNEEAPLAIPLTLEAAVAGAVLTFVNKATGPVTYKVNGGAEQTIASGATENITLENVGDKIEFFGDNKAYATNNSIYSNIACDKDCYVYGNIMSLVNSAHFEKATALEDGCTFGCFFINNTHIKNKSGAPLLLPATTLAKGCYLQMFSGCTNLTAAPSLPATTLTEGCYLQMFSGCTNLTTAPELPAATLANYCYYEMFSSCKSLSSVTCLATDISADMCTYGWLNGVAASGTFTKASSMTSWTRGPSGIPNTIKWNVDTQ